MSAIVLYVNLVSCKYHFAN
uniref:Uncharacterized protein n=1 Tax=Arundo donax TaxID=35708 RepID=A0A0A8YT51_ARUDO